MVNVCSISILKHRQEEHTMDFVKTLIILCSLGYLESEVYVSLHTDFPSSDNSYYIVHGTNITIECWFDSAVEISWKMNQEIVFLYSVATGWSSTSEGFENKIVSNEYSSTKHTLVISIEKASDEGSTITCEVKNSPFASPETASVKIVHIYVLPQSIVLSDIGFIIDGIQTNVQCVVNSVYQGQKVTLFKVKIGNSYLSSGSIMQADGAVNGTYNVIYHQPIIFSYSSQHGQLVRCEMEWMKATSLETAITSASQTLEIYYPATAVALEVSSTTVVLGSSVTFTCATFSNPLPRLRLYKHREGQSTTEVKSVTGITLSWTDSVGAADNKAEFYCRVDDNSDIGGWKFDIQSERQELTVWYKPLVTLNAHTNPNPTEGDTRQINCNSTSANPLPVLTLYREDVEVKIVTGRELSYSVVISRQINGIAYMCTATSSEPGKYAYQVLSSSIYYTVIFPATTIELTSSHIGLIAEDIDVTFACVTDESNPTSNIVWTRDGTILSTGISVSEVSGLYNSNKRISVLRVTTLRSLNGATYMCYVEGRQSVNDSTQLKMKFPVTAVTLSTSSGHVLENTEVTLTCTTDEANPTGVILWTRDGVTVTPDPGDVSTQSGQYNAQRTVSKLRVRVNKTLNGVVYRCTVEGTEVQSEYTMDVTFDATAVTLISSPAGSVSENTEVTINCTTDESNPIAVTVWTIDNVTLTPDPSDVTTHSGLYNAQRRVSILRVRADRTLNGAVYTCAVNGTGISSHYTMDVTYIPSVSVEASSYTIIEGSELVITRKISAGNPVSITILYWEFEPKYPGAESQAVLKDDNRELRIESTVYTDAGTYRCTAGNTVGSDTKEVHVVVHYPPQLYKPTTLTFFSALNEAAVMDISIRAFPEIADLDTAFVWNKRDQEDMMLDAVVKSTRLSEEVFQSLLVINSVDSKDYGGYTVTVENGVNEAVIFLLDLKPRGPPEAPLNVAVVAVGAEEATVCWQSGFNGGLPQTFKVVLTGIVSKEELQYDVPNFDPVIGTKLNLTMTGLRPLTEYQVQVISMNQHDGGSTSASLTTFITQDAVQINGRLTLSIEGKFASLNWGDIQGNYTRAEIAKCVSQNDCITLSNAGNLVAGVNHFIIFSTDIESNQFAFSVYRHQQTIFKGWFVQEYLQNNEASITDSEECHKCDKTGLIVGLSIAVGILVILVCSVLVFGLLRRFRTSNPKSKASCKMETEPQYINVTALEELSHYEASKLEPPTAPAIYAKLDATVYEDMH